MPTYAELNDSEFHGLFAKNVQFEKAADAFVR